jgi:2-dehydropantoate 2-reductase
VRFLVFGAGALGSVVAARLAARHPVSLVGRRAHVDAIRERGLRVSGKTEAVVGSLTAVASIDELDGEPPEVILLTVKAYDTKAATASLAPFHRESTFVSLQNGLGNEEIIAERAARVLGAVINQGATFVGPGEVFHAGAGETTVGPFSGTTIEDAEAVASAFRECGMAAGAVADIRARIWAKVILNAAVNPLTALLRLRTGALLDSEVLAEALRLIVEESVAIAAACDVPLQAAEVLATIRSVAEATRDNKSSMLQDLERGRRTEIDAINGALIARAQEHDIPCPANRLLAAMVRAAEG